MPLKITSTREVSEGCRIYEAELDRFVHKGNLKHYRQLLAGTMHDKQGSQIMKLLAEENASSIKFIEY